MRVVVDGVIFQYRPRGGIARLFRECLPRICDADPATSIELFTEGPADSGSLPAHPGIVHRVLPQLGQRLRPRRLFDRIAHPLQSVARRAILGDGSGSIWHSTYYTDLVGWRGRKVLTVYDMIHERFAAGPFASEADRKFREEKRRLAETADAVICISETTRDDVLHFWRLEPERVFVAPLAASRTFVPLGSEEAAPPPPIPGPFILFIGDRQAYKDFGVVLKALGRTTGLDLVAVGGGAWTMEEAKLIESFGCEGRVHAVDARTDDDLRRVYLTAEALVHPSRYEGFGIPVLEALSCGCPLIASRIPSTVEVAAEAALYFEPGDAEGLTALLELVARGGAPAQLREAGLERARRFDWDSTARATLAVYRSVGAKG